MNRKILWGAFQIAIVIGTALAPISVRADDDWTNLFKIAHSQWDRCVKVAYSELSISTMRPLAAEQAFFACSTEEQTFASAALSNPHLRKDIFDQQFSLLKAHLKQQLISDGRREPPRR